MEAYGAEGNFTLQKEGKAVIMNGYCGGGNLPPRHRIPAGEGREAERNHV